MYCMKCGRETTDEQVFCDSCLQTMAQYPIKPGTPIQLPNRSGGKKQAPRKRQPTAAEQVQQLKRTVKRLIVALAVLTLVLCMTTIVLLQVMHDDATVPVAGKNYSIDTSLAP